MIEFEMVVFQLHNILESMAAFFVCLFFFLFIFDVQLVF